jgi:hypothetical protein
VYDVRVVPEVNADDRRHRSDEAVRRLREESRRRIERRRTAGMSHCMLGTMLAMLLFVALNARLIYWARHAETDESARRPAPAPTVNVEMPGVDEVKVTGFVPRHDGDGRRSEQPRCVVERDLLSGERFFNCTYDGKSRASRPPCGGSHRAH